MDVNDTFVFFEFTNYIKILNSLISNNKTKKPDLIISSFEYYHDVEHLGTNKYFPGAKSKKTKFIDGEKLKLKESISHHALTFSREILQHAKEIPSDLFFTDAPLIQDILQHTKKIAITSKELIFLKFHITNNKVIFANYLHRKHENLKETLLYILDHMHVNNKNSINVSNNIVKITESFIYTMFLLIITNEKLFHVQKKNEINDLISFIEKKYKNKFNIK
jgi:hypothetical protein